VSDARLNGASDTLSCAGLKLSKNFSLPYPFVLTPLF
jgi:hypothetical protein